MATLRGVDLSNHNGHPSTYRGQGWYDLAQFVIVQAVHPPQPYPPGMTDPQLRAAKDDGKYVGVYVWLWNTGDFEADLALKLALIPDDVPLDMRLWLDVEDTSKVLDPNRLARALEICDEWAVPRGLPITGIYTGAWYVETYFPQKWESWPEDRPYWMADYNLSPSEARLFPMRPIHQYTSTPVDQNLMLEEEIVSHSKPPDPVTIPPVPQDYQDKFNVGPNDWPAVAENLEGIIGDLMNRVLKAKEALG